MNSTNSEIFDIIRPLKSVLLPDLFERIQLDLVLRDNRLKSENDELNHKLDKANTSYKIHEKEYRRLLQDHANLKLEYANLEAQYSEETQQLRAENEGQVHELKEQIEVLQEEYAKLSERNEVLVGFEEELRACKEYAKESEKEVGVLREKCKVVEEKLKKLGEKHETLRRDHDAVVNLAGPRFYDFEKLLVKLEGKWALFEGARAKFASGAQEIRSNADEEHPESLTFDAYLKGLGTPSVCETNSLGENPASCAREVNTTGAKKKLSGLGRNVQSEQVSHSRQCASVPLYAVSDSDEENECKGLIKRKQLFPEASNGREYGLSSSKRISKGPHCEEQFGGAFSGNSNKKWDHEADMVDALQKDTELCMKAICALYRQDMAMMRSSDLAGSVPKQRGFSDMDAARGLRLGNFLVAGNAEGGLKRSVAELVKFEPESVLRCRRIAIDHSSRLFDIYKNNEDPHFVP